MQIEQPYYLLGWLLLPAMVLLFIHYRNWRRKALKQFGEWPLVAQLIAANSISRPVIKFCLLLAAFTLIIFALANLQYGSTSRNIRHEGIDLAILLDVSNSMLAADAQPNRLELAKRAATQLISEMPDARIAFITFAAIPVIQTPLTIDHRAAQLLISAISAEDVPEQGSDIGAALLEGIRSLPENQNHYRAIVLFSDGEDQEGALKKAMDAARENQVAVCTAGLGSENGTTIPVREDGIISNKKDQDGQVIVTRFNPSALKAIAVSNHGIFVKVEPGDREAVRSIVHHLDALNKNQFDEQLLIQYESRFQWFLFGAWLLLMMELLISNRKMIGWRNRKAS